MLKNATYVNVFSNELCTANIACANGLIVGIGDYAGEQELDLTGKIVCPGFLDAHIHLESSMVSPTEFVKAVLPHGTTTVVTDPHEITNVMGTDGIEYMLQATEGLPVDVRFMLPSCVPATPMDEAGATLDYRTIDMFYDYPRVQGLAEMMNYIGVIRGDEEVIKKIVAAQAHHKKIDGHAPGLTSKELDTYIAAGVYSDHECATLDDALRKLQRGQFIMIREGTAARNLEALAPLFKKGKLMFDGQQVAPFDPPQIDPHLVAQAHHTFRVAPLTADDFATPRQRAMLGMVPGEIITTDNGYADHIDPAQDILKIAVIERHKGTGHIGLGYLQGYGLKSGAVATSVSHDSHNIIVVGANEADMAFAANQVVASGGGIVVADGGRITGQVVLEIAGLMSEGSLPQVNARLEQAKAAAFRQGVNTGIDPFMTLSFMSLPVIPQLRLTTRGVIDVATQQYL